MAVVLRLYKPDNRLSVPGRLFCWPVISWRVIGKQLVWCAFHRAVVLAHHTSDQLSGTETGSLLSNGTLGVGRMSQLRHPRNVRRNASCLILRQQLRCGSPPWLFLEWPHLVQFLSSCESIDINSLASLELGSTCSNPSINLKYSGPSLSISASACLVNVSTVLVSVFD